MPPRISGLQTYELGAPGVVSRLVSLPARAVGTPAKEIPILGVDSSGGAMWSSVDVWASNIDTNWLRVELRLYARIDGVRTLIDSRVVRDAPLQEQLAAAAPALLGDAPMSGRLFSVKGLWASAWEVVAVQPALATAQIPFRMTVGQSDDAQPLVQYRRTSLAYSQDDGMIGAGDDNPGALSLLQVHGFNRSTTVTAYFMLSDVYAIADALANPPSLPPVAVGPEQVFSISWPDPGWRFERNCVWTWSNNSTLVNPAGTNDLALAFLWRRP